MTDPACRTCALADDPSPTERVWLGQRWRVALSFNSALPGWLVITPRRHLTAIADLADDEAADLGPLLVAASRALRHEIGCPRTYVAQFGEADGFAHVHFHVIPRAVDLPHEHSGPRVFGYLGAPPEQRLPDSEAADLAARLGRRISAELDPTASGGRRSTPAS